jgi:hypothetical protein
MQFAEPSHRPLCNPCHPAYQSPMASTLPPNPHSARDTLIDHSPRVPSLEPFRRRPTAHAATLVIGPASETLHICGSAFRVFDNQADGTCRRRGRANDRLLSHPERRCLPEPLEALDGALPGRGVEVTSELYRLAPHGRARRRGPHAPTLLGRSRRLKGGVPSK